MLNQVQYHQAFVEGRPQGESAGGFQGMIIVILRLLSAFYDSDMG